MAPARRRRRMRRTEHWAGGLRVCLFWDVEHLQRGLARPLGPARSQTSVVFLTWPDNHVGMWLSEDRQGHATQQSRA